MLDTAAVLGAIRGLVAAELAPVAVYAAGDPAHPLPPAAAASPAVFIWRGRTVEYVVTATEQIHEYEVVLTLLQGGAWESGQTDLLPHVDRLMDLFARRLRLGRDDVDVVRFVDCGGLVTVDWGGQRLQGYELRYAVRQRAPASPGV
jgi:hypothetical protein